MIAVTEKREDQTRKGWGSPNCRPVSQSRGPARIHDSGSTPDRKKNLVVARFDFFRDSFANLRFSTSRRHSWSWQSAAARRRFAGELFDATESPRSEEHT